MAAETNGRVPEWLAALGIKPGEYFCESKLKWERAMTARCFPPAARIYACLALATSGFQDEKAWKLVNGKRVDLTPDDVSSRTQTSRKHFREYMEELRLDGMADVRGSTKGHVELYAWQVPLPPVEKEIVPRAGTIFDGSNLDPEVISVLKHCKITTDWSTLSPREREEVTNLANAARAAQNSLRDWAKQRGARDTYKEERNERNEREEVSQSVDVPLEEPGPTDRPEDHSASPVPENPTDGLTPIRNAIPPELIQRCNEPLTDRLLKKIHKELGDAPPDCLTARILQRWDAISKLGMLINLAQDARESWQQTEKLRQKTVPVNGNGSGPEKQSKEQYQREELIGWLTNAVKDETLPAEERADLQKSLDALLVSDTS